MAGLGFQGHADNHTFGFLNFISTNLASEKQFWSMSLQ